MTTGIIINGTVNVPEILPPPAPPDNGAAALVEQGWVTAQDYAREAFDKAVAFLNTLEGLADDLGNLPDVTVNLDAITSELIPYEAPPAVGEPGNMAMTLPSPPTRPNLDILDETIAVLQTWVAGVFTGIEPAVEAQIWDRARARESAITQRRVMDVRRGFAARGFAKPPGAMSLELADALQEQQNKESTISRDIAIEQAKLQQANRHFAMTTIVEVAGGIIKIYAADMSAFVARVEAEVKRAMGEAQIYDSRTKAFVALVDGATSATESSAKVYEAESRVVIQKAGLSIEVVKANVAKMISQLNTLVEIAKGGAQVSAQLAASALSAVNLSGGISASTSESRGASNTNSRSFSVDDRTSFSISHNYSHPDE